MQIIKPPRLQSGDKVGVVAPSQSVNDRLDRFHRALPVLEKELDIKFVLGEHALGEYWYHSATRENRLKDFHSMVTNPDIKAIFFALGGYTAVDLLDGIDYDLVKNNPKIITGISDCTTLLNPIFAKTGLITFHGLEFSFHGYPGRADYQLASLRHNFIAGGKGEIRPNPAWRDWRDTPTSYSGWQTIRGGQSTGKLIGGNLLSLKHFLDTPYSPDLAQATLFLEGYKLDKRAIHAGLADLKLRGVFEKISGLVIGYWVGSDNPGQDYNKRPLESVILEVVGDYSFPIMQVGEIGHYVENAIIPIGAVASIDADKLTFTIEEEVVI